MPASSERAELAELEPSLPEAIVCERNRRAYDYWLKIRGDRPMPSRADINPADIVSVLPGILLLDVTHDPLDFRYRLVGTDLAAHGIDRTGSWMSEIPHQGAGSWVWAACRRAAESGRPLKGNVPYVGKHHEFKRIEDVIMPLSADGSTVNMLFVAIDFI